ncbi:hypothetical protein FN846DRAFT_681018 [Sphaerosporella brunnea]|uniref:Uncharacterized protein n=1 Tax=Sphaerosporella brunnea TaxID=1250544 RepID=A0A5J5EYT2_9PEZI|nr:hypothetical protein FN846DRAFT_681018 [Sphaerosporella brunnea]
MPQKRLVFIATDHGSLHCPPFEGCGVLSRANSLLTKPRPWEYAADMQLQERESRFQPAISLWALRQYGHFMLQPDCVCVASKPLRRSAYCPAAKRLQKNQRKTKEHGIQHHYSDIFTPLLRCTACTRSRALVFLALYFCFWCWGNTSVAVLREIPGKRRDFQSTPSKPALQNPAKPQGTDIWGTIHFPASAMDMDIPYCCCYSVMPCFFSCVRQLLGEMDFPLTVSS